MQQLHESGKVLPVTFRICALQRSVPVVDNRGRSVEMEMRVGGAEGTW